jgi:DNA damage-binding protein 2
VHFQVDAAIYKLLARRCCTLEFHPSRYNLVISGDKKGGVAIWDFDKVVRWKVNGGDMGL